IGIGRCNSRNERKARLVFRLLLDVENLPAAIHAGLEVDVMRAAQLARILVLDIGRGGKGVGRAAEAALHRRGLSFWHCHGRYSENSISLRRQSGPERKISERGWALYRASM